jgi:aspartyl/asparaginyl beta-hydroxylase (cupin superfamily)
MVNTNAIWKTISLRWWTIQFFKNQKAFPKTMDLVSKYPEIISLSFNQLEANGEILPHCGDTNAIYRCHLGIKIPDYLPKPGLRVREEIKSWEEGKWLIFMDAYNPEAFNFCDKKRIIMVIDIMRPEIQMRRRKIISTVLTSLFLQKRAQKFTFIYELPQWAIRIIAIPLIPIAYLSVKCINFLRIY